MYDRTSERTEQEAVRDLVRILQYRRRAWSKSEEKFISAFIDTLPDVQSDGYGNRYLRIDEPGDVPPRILWSAHTDTVHRTDGTQGVGVYTDETTDRQYLCLLGGDDEASNCLGADNGAGCWLLREMILGGVPGLYVFHRCEESGAQGARHFVEKTLPKLGLDLSAAIAFDRRGTSSVITHQGFGRTCSDAFGRQLAGLLNTHGFSYDLDDGGIFTDTVEYAGVVPECTNVSAGTANEHCASELLDLDHVQALRRALLATDFSVLQAVRDPKLCEDDDLFAFGSKQDFHWPREFDDRREYGGADNFADLVEMCVDYPEVVADYLDMMGVTVDVLREHGIETGQIEEKPKRRRRR